MRQNLAQLYKTPDPKEYLEFDFYDADKVKEVNDRLYKDRYAKERTGPPAERLYFAIFPKDIQMIFGYSADLALLYLFEIREAVARNKKDCLLVKDFCKYTGIDEQTVEDFIEES
jgi:hypothetical protein